MPRYFFHVYDGRVDRDDLGHDLRDANAARRHAIALAGRILDHEAHRLGLGELWHMDVADPQGLVLFRLDFNVTTAPALIRDEVSARPP